MICAHLINDLEIVQNLKYLSTPLYLNTYVLYNGHHVMTERVKRKKAKERWVFNVLHVAVKIIMEIWCAEKNK